MTPKQFEEQIELLTGTDVKEINERDEAHLAKILSDDERKIDHSQFNELLLLVNKDRVTRTFFKHFFGDATSITTMVDGIETFREVALLCYGNFIYAYRRLSKIDDQDEFCKELGDAARDPKRTELELKSRPKPLLDIDTIGKNDTPLVGYLSASDLGEDEKKLKVLQAALADASDWATLALAPSMKQVIDAYRDAEAAVTFAEFRQLVETSAPKLLEQRWHLDSIQAIATRNQDVYLTWDHMDIYFATSMREPWEYEDLYDFIQAVMNCADIKGLQLRYFDPTQCYTKNRINKGLVEALMLKRAKCTVYSVQDTDTLGKDSELASTLAQGKTVIAYVPQITVSNRIAELEARPPEQILKRLNFVSYADAKFAERLQSPIQPIVDALSKYRNGRLWRTISDRATEDEFKKALEREIREACRVIAESEKAIYDRRAETLIDRHPLGIQVNLDTGVANGVLVVRDSATCAELLRQVILGSMEFILSEASDTKGMWELREKISKSVYRVVTDDRKLNNCFWNFYRLGKE